MPASMLTFSLQQLLVSWLSSWWRYSLMAQSHHLFAFAQNSFMVFDSTQPEIWCLHHVSQPTLQACFLTLSPFSPDTPHFLHLFPEHARVTAPQVLPQGHSAPTALMVPSSCCHAFTPDILINTFPQFLQEYDIITWYLTIGHVWPPYLRRQLVSLGFFFNLTSCFFIDF